MQVALPLEEHPVLIAAEASPPPPVSFQFVCLEINNEHLGPGYGSQKSKCVAFVAACPPQHTSVHESSSELYPPPPKTPTCA